MSESMAAPQNLSSFTCELRIIEAKNLDFISTGKLFIRCYLCTRNNQRIRLMNSREIPSTSHPYWNESASLECSAANFNCMDELKQQSVVFELRWRNNSSMLGRIRGSKLLGRAEISWKDVLESSELVVQRWVTAAPTSSNHVLEGLKPPALHVGMNVRVPTVEDMVNRRRYTAFKRWNDCGCRHGNCCSSVDDELFALTAAIEAF